MTCWTSIKKADYDWASQILLHQNMIVDLHFYALLILYDTAQFVTLCGMAYVLPKKDILVFLLNGMLVCDFPVVRSEQNIFGEINVESLI